MPHRGRVEQGPVFNELAVPHADHVDAGDLVSVARTPCACREGYSGMPRAAVLLNGYGHHAGVEQDDWFGVGVRRSDDGGGALDADLRGGQAHALAEHVMLANTLHAGEEL